MLVIPASTKYWIELFFLSRVVPLKAGTWGSGRLAPSSGHSKMRPGGPTSHALGSGGQTSHALWHGLCRS